MSEEEIRMRCLELAASIVGEIDSNEQLKVIANDLRDYVIQDRYPTKEQIKGLKDQLEFEKINPNRSK